MHLDPDSLDPEISEAIKAMNYRRRMARQILRGNSPLDPEPSFTQPRSPIPSHGLTIPIPNSSLETEPISRSATGPASKPIVPIPFTTPPQPTRTEWFNNSSGSFIPSTYISYRNQRIALFSLMMIIQSLKLMEFNKGGTMGGTTLIWTMTKWFAADYMALMLMEGLNVPMLAFEPWQQAWIMAGLSGFSCLVLSGFDPLLSLLPLPFRSFLPSSKTPSADINKGQLENLLYEIGIGSEKKFNRKDVLDSHSHLLGKTTVKVLAHSIVQMNPNKDSFCILKDLNGNYPEPINIPIYINGTNPSLLKYTHFTLQGHFVKSYDTKLYNFALKHIQGKDTDLVTGIYDLEIKMPGKYVLDEVLDNKGFSFRKAKRFGEVHVVGCPSANFRAPKSSKINPINYCIGGGKTLKLELEVKGIAPLSVTYAKKVNSSDNYITIPKVGSSDVAEFAGGLDLDLDIYKSGLYSVSLIKIEDGMNNTLSFDRIDSKYKRDEQMTFVEANDLPMASLSNTNDSNMYLSPNQPRVVFPVQMIGTPPFVVRLGYCPPHHTKNDDCFAEYMKGKFYDHLGEFKLDNPGRYKLLEVRDKNCNNSNLGSEIATVVNLPPPTMQITSKPIFGQCKDAIGLDVTLMVNGNGPFRVIYTESAHYEDGRELTLSRELNVANLLHTFQLRPEVSGTYTYEFHTLISEDYGEVKIDKQLEQTVLAPPTAKFRMDTSIPVRTCIDQTIHFRHTQVDLTGIPPFQLEYTIFHQSSSTTYIVRNIDKFTLGIPLPPFKQSGRYAFQLTKITDNNQCPNQPNERSLTVDVRKDVPVVKFQCKSTDPLTGQEITGHQLELEGSRPSLPLKLEGEKPWMIFIQLPDNTTQSHQIDQPDGFIATTPGNYKILDVMDKTCAGQVDLEHDSCYLQWLPKPRLEIYPESTSLKRVGNGDLFVKRGICQGTPDRLNIHLFGKAPFNLAYNLLVHETKANQQLTVSVPVNKGYVNLDTHHPGNHHYTFLTVSDHLYSNVTLKSHIIVDQEVYALPKASISSSIPEKWCAGHPLPELKLDFLGRAPFQVSLEWRDESQQLYYLQLDNVPGPTYHFTPTLPSTNSGSYSLRVIKVQDANGCTSTSDLLNEPIKVQIYDPPTLQPRSHPALKQHACVGDLLAYTLEGISPWRVQYTMNGTSHQPGEQISSRFARLATDPGTFAIKNVCHLDPQAKCCKEPDSNRFETIIHDLPTAVIDEGSEHVVNIREGDQATIEVKLLGSPPFQFTYTRADIKTQKVMETHTVKDINTNIYNLITAQEGTFQIISIKDNFCQYPLATDPEL